MSTLNAKQIANARKLIDRMQPGEYELEQIYGSRWKSIDSPTTFGKRFKATVGAGLLDNIKIGGLKTNNHRTYVLGSS